MLILYNILQLILLTLLFPLLLIYIAAKSKYRGHIPRRLGLGLANQLAGYNPTAKTIWIHALSVGEVSSAVPLVEKFLQDSRDITIVFSAATKSGYDLASGLLANKQCNIIAFPLDIAPVVSRYISLIKPDLFVLIETDFWPNILHLLARKKIPAVLVNARISAESMRHYSKLSFFFKPLFQSFCHICVQRDSDRKRLIDFGLEEDKITKLGNLKYEPISTGNNTAILQLLQPLKSLLFVAGSTHPGEEEKILSIYLKLKKQYDFKMIIAPRDIKRTPEILHLAEAMNLTVQRRTSGYPFTQDLLVLDTIGELTGFYGEADICFVGGSLVDEGGHNPLEPAAQGKPVLFGPFMHDFEDITKDITEAGGGFTVLDEHDMSNRLSLFLSDHQAREKCGAAARKCIINKKGLLAEHVDLLLDQL